jgi:hypothetical protein
MVKEVTGFRLLLQQLRALLWIGFVVKKRHWLSTTFEVVFPLLQTAFFAFVMTPLLLDRRDNSQSVMMDPEIYDEPFSILPRDLLHLNGTNRYLFYAPETPRTKAFTTRMNELFKEKTKLPWFDLQLVGFPTESAMMKRHTELITNESISTDINAIMFYHLPDKFNSPSSELKYEIRSNNPLDTIGTDWAKKFDQSPMYTGWSSYKNGFLQLQYLVNEVYLEFKARDLGILNKLKRASEISMTHTPYPAYQRSGNEIMMGQVVPGLIMGCFVISFPMIIKRLTDEKTNGAREMFKMTGKWKEERLVAFHGQRSLDHADVDSEHT